MSYDDSNIENQKFYIESSIYEIEKSRCISEQMDDAKVQDKISLNLFFDSKSNIPLGFGWQHDQKYCYAYFQYGSRFSEALEENEIYLKAIT